ncbi:hypothetical protein NC652_033432 [Populus alba x Populus x berolinensis]|nr:hypothetical protein NC652_033432 [Populus alba x Populus x berolinensis]
MVFSKLPGLPIEETKSNDDRLRLSTRIDKNEKILYNPRRPVCHTTESCKTSSSPSELAPVDELAFMNPGGTLCRPRTSGSRRYRTHTTIYHHRSGKMERSNATQ